MRNPEDATHAVAVVHVEDPDLVYANDVRIMAEPGGLQLTFLRPRAAADDLRRTSRGEEEAEVIARVVLPPLAARRLLRLLPQRLDLQQALAEEYARETDAEVVDDPLLAALAEAEYDDEPFTEEDRAADEAGWDDYLHGRARPLDEVLERVARERPTSAKAS